MLSDCLLIIYVYTLRLISGTVKNLIKEASFCSGPLLLMMLEANQNVSVSAQAVDGT